MKRVVLAIASLVVSISAPGWAGMIEDYPDAIVCKIDKRRIVLYIDRVLDDGRAIYKVIGGQFVEVDADGVLHRENAPGDCIGKTIEQLRREGKTGDFAK